MLQTIRKYIFEFLIIFLSVYLAFLFDDYREYLKDREIRIKYYHSLVFEFEIFAQHLEDENKKIEEYIKILDQIEAGQTPKLKITDLYYLYNGAVVKAAFNSQNFESLDRELIQSIIRGSLKLEVLRSRVDRLKLLQSRVLLPLMAEENPLFYDENRKLLPHLRWYPKLIKEIHKTNRELLFVVNERAIPDMKKQAEGLEKLVF